MKLFIIGNGFDLDHNLLSKFSDFKKYLKTTYLPKYNYDYPTLPNVGVDKDGDEAVDPISAAQILYALVNHISEYSTWQDFEKCLGKLDYQEILDMVEKDDEKPFYYFNSLEDIVEDFNHTMKFAISKLFVEWIEQIDYSNASKKYEFKEDDLFLSFNYTHVLEDVYGIMPENICHIHGSANGGLCIIGHGNVDREFEEYDEFILVK